MYVCMYVCIYSCCSSQRSEGPIERFCGVRYYIYHNIFVILNRLFPFTI